MINAPQTFQGPQIRWFWTDGGMYYHHSKVLLSNELNDKYKGKYAVHTDEEPVPKEMVEGIEKSLSEGDGDFLTSAPANPLKLIDDGVQKALEKADVPWDEREQALPDALIQGIRRNNVKRVGTLVELTQEE